MKILVLHGDDMPNLKSRLREIVVSVRKNNRSAVEINEKSGFELGEMLSSNSLFDNEPLFILRDIGKISPNKLKWVFTKKETFSGTFMIVNEGYLPAKILSLIPKDAKVELFKLPKIIYKFLDSLYPGNTANSLLFLHQLVNKEAPEYLIAILGRHFRDLYWASVDPSTLPYKEDWRNVKLVNQAERFDNGQLKNVIRQLAEFDVVLKTSSEPFEGLLDQLIVTQLE